MERILLVAFLCYFFIDPTHGQVLGFGTCPQVTPAAKTTATTIQGQWFEQMRFISRKEHRYVCVTYTFRPLNPGNPAKKAKGDKKKDDDDPKNVLSLSSSIVGINKFTGKVRSINGNLRYIPQSFAIMSVNYPYYAHFPQNFINIGFKSKRWVVLYSCSNYGFFHIMQVLLLTSAQVPLARDLDDATSVIIANELPKFYLKKVRQSKCVLKK